MKEINTIYIIKNNITDKVYIGQTWSNIKYRFNKHTKQSTKGCPKLYNAIKKYGKENFYIEPLFSCWTQQDADFYEDYFIKYYDSINNGLNIKEGGRGGKHSNETINKISNTLKGRKPSINAINKLIERNLSDDNPCYHVTDEQRLQKSINSLGVKNPFFGKKHTDENIEKMSELKQGNKNPMFGKSGINSPTFGYKRSPESIAKMLETRARNKALKEQGK